MDEKAIRKHLFSLGVGPLIKQRDWINAPCPLAPWRHRSGRDRKPSFGVKITKGGQSHFFCFTCKATGRMHDLAADLGRLRGEDYSDVMQQSFRDDIISISDYEDVTDREEKPEPLDPEIYGDLYDPVMMHREAMEYLEDRGISANTARTLGLMYDEEDQRIIFPVKDRKGRLYGFSGRTILEEEDYPGQYYPKVKDYMGLPKKFLLLGEERVQRGKPVFVVEGLFAYATLIEIGIEDVACCVALLGSTMTQYKAERLQRINEDTYLLTDPDEAGDICLWGKIENGEHQGDGAIDRLVDHVPLYVPEFPDGVNDVDDFEFDDLIHILDNTHLYERA